MTDQEKRWEWAVQRARDILELYEELGPQGIFGAITINEKLELYEAGDRSEALLTALENIE